MSLPLPDDDLPKARRYMRALRRAVLAYWYATLEDPEVAALEAATATFYVNILDESVFEMALEEPYRVLRRDTPLGRVVTGLELVRNCETHARVLAEGLLVTRGMLSVPLNGGGTIMRSVFAWTEYSQLPVDYRDLPAGAREGQVRARREAQHGYKDAVQDRHVIETLFDAMAFFEAIDPRLVGAEGPRLPWAYGEAYAQLPDSSLDADPAPNWLLARPMGLDLYELFLPDIRCRYTERRSAGWPAADTTFKDRRKSAASELPSAAERQVAHVLIDGDQVLGYGGYGPTVGNHRNTWVERRQQVGRDVRRGYRYYLVDGGAEIDLIPLGHNQVTAPSPAVGGDLLVKLPPASSGALGSDRLTMVEQYYDMYVEMRNAD